VLSIHARGKVPRTFGIEGIAHDYFPSPIGSALLKMVTIGNEVIIVAGPTSSFWTIWIFATYGEGSSIESPDDNFFM